MEKSSPKKKKKEHRPFRIRTGCLVALRHSKVDENKNNESTWINPPPFGDNMWFLLGRTLRCSYPNDETTKKKNGETNTKKKKKNIMIEGEVAVLYPSKTSNATFVSVDMVVSKTQPLPVGVVPVQDNTNDNPALVSSKERRNLEYEHSIRGKNTILVRIRLGWPTYPKKHNEDDEKVCGKWVIRHTLPPKAQSGFVGNHLDSEKQQATNWRWIAHQQCFSSLKQQTNNTNNCFYRVDKVVLNKTPPKNGDSLANVALTPFVALGNSDGNPRFHGATAPFLLLDCNNDERQKTLTVPIEQVVVAAKKIVSLQENAKEDLNVYNNQHRIAIHVGRYHPTRHSWTRLLDASTSAGDCCHCCRWEGTELVTRNTQKYCPRCASSWNCQCLACCESYAQARHDAFLRQQQQQYIEIRTPSPKKDYISSAQPDCAVCSFPLGDDSSYSNIRSFAATTTTNHTNTKNATMHPSCAKWVSTVQRVQRERRERLQKNGDSPLLAANDIAVVDFDLPPSIFPKDLAWIEPISNKPITTKPKRNKKRKKSTSTQENNNNNHTNTKQKKRAKKAAGVTTTTSTQTAAAATITAQQEDSTAFAPTCSRLLPFNSTLCQFDPPHKDLIRSNTIHHELLPKDRPRIQRRETQLLTQTIDPTKSTTKSNRAARANQRRLQRALPKTSLLTGDALSGRQNSHLLRFDRSKVHAWGVFSDSPIAKGDLVVEYRGEIIGNAVAEKREQQVYSKSDVDYMFRIDPYTVCDATRLGNVARFINASCEPNCVAQIIHANHYRNNHSTTSTTQQPTQQSQRHATTTSEEPITSSSSQSCCNKRIVIYAKQDIAVGEELCYDYKFPMEYDDPSKRIPCRCGTPSCRGYMNWDKKFDTKEQRKKRKQEETIDNSQFE